jgi:hypothetical protein
LSRDVLAPINLGSPEASLHTLDEPVIRKVVAIYEYQAQNKEELSLEVGDLVDVTEMQDDWWIGKLNGKMGIFPSNFVKDYDPNESNEDAANDVVDLLGMATALYEYLPQEPTELSFKEGAQIEVYHMGEDGWWQGRTEDGKIGLFPSNFVQFQGSQ